MEPDIDTHLNDKYRGLWIALDDDRETVVGSGPNPEEAFQQAKANGSEDPVLTYVFAHDGTFIGGFPRELQQRRRKIPS